MMSASSGVRRQLVALPDGRDLDAVVGGARSDTALLMILGRPTGAVPYGPAVAIASERAMGYLSFARPGHARSTRAPGRAVADVAQDIADLADALGFRRLFVVGWSGGGPYALAAAARLPERVESAAVIASLAPHREDGVDLREWLGRDRFHMQWTGEGLVEDMEAWASELGRSGAEVRRQMADWASEADLEVLEGDIADHIAAQYEDAFSTGIWGAHDESRSLVRDWGIDLEAISRPVAVWHGTEDNLVPVEHGRWLADHVAGVRAHFIDGEGHISIGVRYLGRIVDELVEMAASQGRGATPTSTGSP
jgi:pimeloyl-ACP methyl ester carboxylesterase